MALEDDKPTASRLSDPERDLDLKGSIVAGVDDPDEGRSEEERAAIVCDPSLGIVCRAETVRNRGYFKWLTAAGSEAVVETRPSPRALAKSPLSSVVSGSVRKLSLRARRNLTHRKNKYRQCKARRLAR